MSEVRNLNRPIILELVDQLNALQYDLFTGSILTKYHADVVPSLASITDGYCSDLANTIVEVNDLKVAYGLHIASAKTATSVGAHLTADAVNTISAADASDLATAITLANDIKAKYNVHRVSTVFHKVADSTNAVTSDDAYDLTSLKILVEEIAGDLAAHVAGAFNSTAVVLLSAWYFIKNRTMKYQNKLNQEISFSIAGIKYKVPAMDSVEIPDKFDYVIDSRKLPMIKFKEEIIEKEEKSFLPIDDLVIKPKAKPGPKPKKDK